MKNMILVLSILLCFLLSGCSPGGSNTDPLEGVWQMTGSESLLADGTREINTPQENLFLFQKGYYSMAFAVGDERSLAYAERFSPTDEEKAARMSSITVNTGTYAVSGSIVTLRPIFALVPEFVEGILEVEYERSSDSLKLKWKLIKSADGVRQPYNAAGNSFEVTLVRIQ